MLLAAADVGAFFGIVCTSTRSKPDLAVESLGVTLQRGHTARAIGESKLLQVVESVYQRDDLIKRANGNLSHKTPRAQTGSIRVEGSDKWGTYS